MTEAFVAETLAALDLTETAPDTYEAKNLFRPHGRIYGGQVLAQALLAAGFSTPSDRLPHSMHGYFIRPGDINLPVLLEVERMRDGGSFSSRRTHAIQDGKPILSMIASFQELQPGREFAETMPQVPGPDDLPTAMESVSGDALLRAKYWTQDGLLDIRHCEGNLFGSPAVPQTHVQHTWIRLTADVPADQLFQRVLLAYLCDQVMLEPALRAQGESWATPGLNIASLDHAMWWHRNVTVTEWMLFAQESPSAQGGRGLTNAKVFNQQGQLIASMVQEGMLRFPDDRDS